MTTNQRVLMRLLTCLLGIVLSATSVDCAASPPSPGPSALRLGLHVPSTVTLYSPRYEGGSWESNFGVVLKQALQDELPAAFSKVESLPSFPPSGETPNLDAYIVVEQTVARFYGKAAMTAEAQATLSVFNAAREPVKDLQVSTDYKATFSKDTQQARCDAAVRQVAHELVTELIAALTQPELHSQLERSV